MSAFNKITKSLLEINDNNDLTIIINDENETNKKIRFQIVELWKSMTKTYTYNEPRRCDLSKIVKIFILYEPLLETKLGVYFKMIEEYVFENYCACLDGDIVALEMIADKVPVKNYTDCHKNQLRNKEDATEFNYLIKDLLNTPNDSFGDFEALIKTYQYEYPTKKQFKQICKVFIERVDDLHNHKFRTDDMIQYVYGLLDLNRYAALTIVVS
jgi:hypothetical protein